MRPSNTDKRLTRLLDALDAGAVQPDELIKAIDAVVAIVDANGKSLVDKLMENKSASDADIKGLQADLKQTKTNLERVISDVKMSSKTNVDGVRAALLTEIKRVESLIPELPPETDLSEVFGEFAAQREELERVGSLVMGENIRNALESLTDDDRLDKSAIRGLDEAIESLEKANSKRETNFGFVIRDVQAGTGVTIDKKDPNRPIISASGGSGGYTNLTEFVDQTAHRVFYSNADGDVTELALGADGTFLKSNGATSAPSFATPAGSGDMAAATYDPQAIAADAFDTDNHTDGTTNKVYTATEKTKLAGIEASADVTDTANVTAAGALMDSEVTNLAQVKAFDSADYATAAQGAKVDFLTVTQAVDLDQMETDIAALANGMVYKGDWDASAGTFPGAGSAQTGWFYYVSVAGTVDSISFAVGDNIVATTDNASTTVYAANWSKHDQTDAVQSVAGKVGAVTLVNTDITDFQAAVAANSAVAANTAKVTNATHTGDVTGSTALTIANSAVTLAKMADLAQDQFIGRTTASTGVPQTATITAAARTVLDDTTVAAMVNTLGGATSTGTGGLVRTGSPALVTPSIAAIVVSGGTLTLPTGATDTLVSRTSTDTLTNKTLTAPVLNTSVSGTAIANAAAINTGTSATTIVTPDGLAGSYAGTKSVSIQVQDGATALATGDGAAFFMVPAELDGMDLIGVIGGVVTAGTTGTTDFQIHNVTDAVDMLSTKLTIDSGETTSATAATAPVINTSNDSVATNDVLRIDVDAVSTTAPEGGFITLSFRKP